MLFFFVEHRKTLNKNWIKCVKLETYKMNMNFFLLNTRNLIKRKEKDNETWHFYDKIMT